MDPILAGVVAIVVLLGLMATGIPIAVSLLLVGFVGMWIERGLMPGLWAIATTTYAGVAVLGFTVIPMFILMGVLVGEAGLSGKAFAFSYKWLGRLPGGLAIASTGACALFGAVSGSSIAAVATIGRIAVPEMVDKYNYNRSLAAGCVAASGTLAIMIPPSIALAIYAILVEVSIAKVLMAGIIPGFLSAAIYMVMVAIRVKLKPSLAPMVPERVTWGEKLRSIPSIWQIALLFSIIIGGIYTGVMTPTEAAGVAAFLALLMVVAIRKRRAFGVVRGAFWEAASVTAMLFLLLVGARVLGLYLTHLGFGQALGNAILSWPLPPVVSLLLMLSLYFPLGMVMSTLPIIIMTMPFMFPVVIALGMSPIWFGIIIVKLVEIALITPPVCLNVFTLQGVMPGYTFGEVVRGTLWFLVVDVVTLAILFAFPQISLFIPNLMFG